MRRIIILLLLSVLFHAKGFSQVEIRKLYDFPDSIVVDDTASFGIIIEYTGVSEFYDSLAVRYAVNNDTALLPMNTQFFPIDTLRPFFTTDTLASDEFIFSSQYFTPGPDIVIIWPETNAGKVGTDRADTVKIKASTGIGEYSFNDGALVIYPVPFRENLNLFSKSGISSLKVFNNSGKMILNKKDISTINSEGWMPGVYFIEVIDKNGAFYRRKVIRY